MKPVKMKTIKMKAVDVGDDSFAKYNEEPNEKDPKFKVGDHVRISNFKNVFAKVYTVQKLERRNLCC